MMKKTITFLPDSRTSYLRSHSHPIGYASKKSAYLTDPAFSNNHQNTLNISEKYFNFSINLNLLDQERYGKSFLKKRLLHIWKKQRTLVIAAPKLPTDMEQAILRAVCEEITPVLQASYREDFPYPLTPFTLFGWLQTMKLIAQIQELDMDVVFWEEMIAFFNRCENHQLLNRYL